MNHKRLYEWITVCVAIVTLFGGLLVGMLLGTVRTVNNGALLPPGGALEELAAAVEKYYVGGPYDDSAAKLAAEKAFVSELGDPYSCFYSTEEYDRQTQTRNGSYAGIGVTVEEKEAGITITKVADNGPAKDAGLQVGDVLLVFNGHDMRGLKIADLGGVVSLEEGQTIVVTVLRDGAELDFSLTAAVVVSDMARVEFVGDVACIAVSSFYGNAPQLVADYIAQAEEKGCRAIVVDLRGNPGGDLGVLMDLAADFIGKKEIIYFEYKDGSHDSFTGRHDALTDLPVAVLINGNSASASEAFSGCLQAHKRAVIVGEKSFGKGIAQQSFRLTGGVATLTVAKYYLPDGRCIHGEGITPDIVVAAGESETLAADPQFMAAVQALQNDKED